jgi:hypothetical protein
MVHKISVLLFKGLTGYGGGALTVVPTRLCSSMRRYMYGLALCFESVWVEIPTVDGINLPTGNHCFSPDTTAEVLLLAVSPSRKYSGH